MMVSMLLVILHGGANLIGLVPEIQKRFSNLPLKSEAEL